MTHVGREGSKNHWNKLVIFEKLGKDIFVMLKDLPSPPDSEKQNQTELNPTQRRILIELMRPRGLLKQRNQLLPICEQLYQEHARNFTEEWGNFQLGHLLAAARLEMLLGADNLTQKAQKKRFLRKTGLSEEYLRESLAYRLSADILAYQPEYQVDDDITAAEAQPLQDQFLKERGERKLALMERMRSLFPHFSEKSLAEEELIYMVMRDANQERISAGLPAFSHSLDDVLWLRTAKERAELEMNFSGRDSLQSSDLSWQGKVKSSFGVAILADADNLDMIKNLSSSEKRKMANFLKARILYHELAMHYANLPHITRDLEGRVTILNNSDNLVPRTGFEQLIFDRCQPTGLLESIAAYGDCQYSAQIAQDRERMAFLGTRMSEAKLKDVLARSTVYKTLMTALSQLFKQWADKAQLNLATVWRPTFTLFQRGRMDDVVRMFNNQLGDAVGSFFAQMATFPDQRELIHAFIVTDQKGKIALLLRLVKEKQGIDVNVSPRLEEVWRGNNGLKQTVVNELDLSGALPSRIPSYEFLRKLARERLLAGKIDHALDPDLEDIRAMEIARRKYSTLTETMQSGVDTAAMMINGFFEEHAGALNPQIMSFIRDSLAEDETGWEFVVQLKQAFSQIVEHRVLGGAINMELAQEINDYLGGIIDSDLQDKPVEFVFGLFWALDEYQMALINQVQETLLKPINKGPLVVGRSSTG